MDKNIITVSLTDGTKKNMELIFVFHDDITRNDYILYKDIGAKDECWAAKFTIVDNNIYKLDTNLTEEEILKLQVLLDSHGGNIE